MEFSSEVWTISAVWLCAAVCMGSTNETQGEEEGRRSGEKTLPWEGGVVVDLGRVGNGLKCVGLVEITC